MRDSKTAFTLVELLVAIAIIAALVAITLPAVSGSREAARRIRCSSNLKQISLGILTYGDIHGSIPHGGWGHAWVGMADRGNGVDQPGGWAYSILPFIEQASLHQMDAGLSPLEANAARGRRLAVPLKIFSCSSRRTAVPLPTASEFLNAPGQLQAHLKAPYMCPTVDLVARGDYAINSGTSYMMGFPGPSTLAEGDSPDFHWPAPRKYDGVSHLRLGARMQSITDGLSNTYLVGEKFLSPSHYYDGLALGDNETLYSGFSSDAHRFCAVSLPPLRDNSSEAISQGNWRFGSAHPSVLNISMCDGSVREVGYDIDPMLHSQAGSRTEPWKREHIRF